MTAMKPKTKQKRGRGQKSPESSPLTMLESELRTLHHDLRTVAKAYVTRLENDLLVCIAALRTYGPIERVAREVLQEIRDLTIVVRKRRLKPEKGRRKDLRKIDSLIGDLVSTMGHKS
jgi:hypothetical protein